MKRKYQKPSIENTYSSNQLIEAGPGNTRDQGVPAPGMGYYGSPDNTGVALSVTAIITIGIALVGWILAW